MKTIKLVSESYDFLERKRNKFKKNNYFCDQFSFYVVNKISNLTQFYKEIKTKKESQNCHLPLKVPDIPEVTLDCFVAVLWTRAICVN